MPAAGLSGCGWEGAPRSGPTPRSPGTPRDARRRRRPRKATGYSGAGLWTVGVGDSAPPPRETARVRVLQPVPRSPPQVPAPELPRSPRRAASRPPGRAAAGQSASPGYSAPTRAPRRGSRVRPPPPACRCPRQCPAQRGPARPGLDSWVPKGLSRQRGGPSAPRAASPPRAGPSAHAPARYLRSRSRSSSTWLLSPGGRPSARPLGSAPRTLLATRPRPGEEGRGAITIY